MGKRENAARERERRNRSRIKETVAAFGLSSGLLGGGREDAAALLLEEHDVESVKVRERAARLDGSALLGPTGLSPLLGDVGLVEELLDGGRASATGETGHGELGEGEVLEGEHLTSNTGGGRVNDGLQLLEQCEGQGERASQCLVLER